ncbi:MAG: PEGA domain-containing protein [Acidobacteriota bacterium]
MMRKPAVAVLALFFCSSFLGAAHRYPRHRSFGTYGSYFFYPYGGNRHFRPHNGHGRHYGADSLRYYQPFLYYPFSYGADSLRYYQPFLDYPVSSYSTPPSANFPAGRATYRVVLAVPPASEVVRANYSDLIFDVTPPRALVYVDGRLIGSARSFATERDRFTLLEGEHELRIEFPGRKPYETQLQVIPDRTIHIDVELEPAQR